MKSKLPVCLFLILWLHLPSFSQSAFRGNAKTKLRAFIVGISDYSKNKYVESLEYSDDDALAFYTVLNNYLGVSEERLQLLLNCSSEEFSTRLREFLTKAQLGDQIIIYFAGHADTHEGTQEGFLLFSNALSDGDYHENGAYSMNDLKYDLLQSIEDKNLKIVLITDACRSGAIDQTVEATQEELTDVWNQTTKIVSSGIHQQSYEGKQWGGGHGVFTYHLLNALHGLADQNDDIWVDIEEAVQYLVPKVSKDTEQKQNPQLINGKDASAIRFAFDPQKKIQSLDKVLLALNSVSTSTEKTRGFGQALTLNPLQKMQLQKFEDAIEQGLILPPTFLPDYREEKAQVSPLKTIELHGGRINVIQSSPSDSLVYSGDRYSNLVVTDLSSGQTHKTRIFSEQEPIQDMAFAGNDLLLILSQKGNLKAFAPSSRQLSSPPTWIPKKGIVGMSSHPNRQLVAFISEKGRVDIYHTTKQKKVARYQSPKLDVQSVLFHPKQKLVFISGLSSTIHVVSTQTGQVVRNLKQSGGFVQNLQISANGKKLASLDKRKINLWDCESWERIYESKHQLEINDMALSCAGDKIFFLHKDRNRQGTGLTLVSVSGQEEQNFRVEGSDIQYLRYFPSFELFFMGRRYGKVELMKLESSLNYASFYFQEFLLQDTSFKAAIPDLRGTIAISLQELAQQIIDPFIEGASILPSSPALKEAIVQLEWVLSLYETEANASIYKKVKIKRDFLTAMEILVSNRTEQYPEAESLLTTISHQLPEASFPKQALGSLVRRQNRIEEAKSYINFAIEKIPLWTEPKKELGITYLQEGEYESARVEFEKIIQIAPNDPKGYYLMGKLSLFLEDLGAAESYLTEALDAAYARVDTESEAVISVSIAELRLMQGNYQEAEATLLQLVEGPAKQEAMVLLGKLYIQIVDEYPLAQTFVPRIIDISQKVITEWPNDPRGYLNYIQGLFHARIQVIGAPDLSRKIGLVTYQIGQQHFDIYRELAKSLKKLKELNPYLLEYAEANLQYSLDKQPKSKWKDNIATLLENQLTPETLYIVGNAFAYRQAWDQAKTYYLKALEADDTYYPPQGELLGIYAQTKQLSAFESLFQRLKSQFPNNPDPYFRRAKFLLQQGKTTECQAMLQQALRINPKFWFAQRMFTLLDETDDYKINLQLPATLNIIENGKGLYRLRTQRSSGDARFYLMNAVGEAVFQEQFSWVDDKPIDPRLPHLVLTSTIDAKGQEVLGALNIKTQKLVIPMVFEKINFGTWSGTPRAIARLNAEDPEEKGFFYKEDGTYDYNPSATLSVEEKLNRD